MCQYLNKKHVYVPMFDPPIQTLAHSNISTFKQLQLNFRLWQLKVPKLSLFQVAEAPMNMYDYPIPFQPGPVLLQED